MSRRYSAMSLRERAWPEDLAPRIRSDVLEYFCNGQIDYGVRGVHVRLEVPWFEEASITIRSTGSNLLGALRRKSLQRSPTPTRHVFAKEKMYRSGEIG